MTSIDQGLVGRASGVQVTQTSGMPGAVASIRVRGSSSLQGGNEPLYVIDGFPVYSGTGFGSTGGNTQISGLSTVNPSDIESIEILKMLPQQPFMEHVPLMVLYLLRRRVVRRDVI